MAMSEENTELCNKIDQALRDPDDREFDQLALIDYGMSMADWYARLLSSLAVLIGDAEIVYAQSRVPDVDGVEVVIFTPDLLVTATVDDVKVPGAAGFPRAVSRKLLRALEVEATTPANERGRAAQGWPGSLRVRLDYAGEPTPIELTGDSYARYRPDNIAPIWALVQSLREDLAAAT